MPQVGASAALDHLPSAFSHLPSAFRPLPSAIYFFGAGRLSSRFLNASKFGVSRVRPFNCAAG